MIDAASCKEKYDASVKAVLADKQVLARILKYTLDEFKDDSIEEIIECISEPEIGNVAVNPGSTNTEKIKEGNSEDSVLGEGKIVFDIRFSAWKKDMQIKILIKEESEYYV